MICCIPTVLIWFVNAPFSMAGTIHVLLIPLVLSLLILVLSAILGWVVALIATKVKHKNIITVLVSLIFITAYYYLYAQAYSFLQTILLNVELVGDRLKKVLYLLYHMGMAAQGNVLSMLIFTAIIAVLIVITYKVLSRSFLKLATASHSAVKSVYKERTAKTTDVHSALLRKEWYRFTGSANYMLNCGLGVILMPLSAAVFVWKAEPIREFAFMPFIREYIPLLAIATICLLMTMNDMTAPSISMEGKNLWILRSLPVSGRQVLMAKLKFPLLLTWISAIPLVIVVEWLIRPSLLNSILIPVAACFYAVLMAEIGLVLNLKMPNLHWTNEIVPLKQSAPITIALFGGWLIIVALAGIYVLLKNAVSVDTFFALLCAVMLIASGWLYHWLTTKGTKIFETL